MMHKKIKKGTQHMMHNMGQKEKPKICSHKEMMTSTKNSMKIKNKMCWCPLRKKKKNTTEYTIMIVMI